MKKRFLAMLLIFILCSTLLPMQAAADGEPYALQITVNGEQKAVRAYNDSYEGNLYLSLTDLSAALSGTPAQFRLDYSSSAADGERFLLTTGQSAGAVSRPEYSASHAPLALSLQRNRLYVNGAERRYYSYRPKERDLYLSLTDIQLILDVTITRDGEALHLWPELPFDPDPAQLAAEGFFDSCNAVLLADAETGAVLFSHDSGRSFPIASLSKLMSYLLIAEDLASGAISLNDSVPISAAADALSRSSDGVVRLTAGRSVPLRELLQAMLLASSNEAALALAEYCAGTEEAFVERMNARASELGLRTARFYSPHGLPVYSGGSVTGKLQNRMSASDMFTLSRYLLAHFPEITEITSLRYCQMPTLSFNTANSNPLVFNMDGITGLKTGSTNRAGYCVVVSMPVSSGAQTHDLVLVLFGAETPTLRGQAAEILLRWARRQITREGFPEPSPLLLGLKG